MSNMDSAASGLHDEKIKREIEKIGTETELLKRSQWKSLPFISSVFVLFASLTGNAIQFYAASIADANAKRKIDILQENSEAEKGKLKAEIQKLNADVNLMQTAENAKKAATDVINNELELIVRDIAKWDRFIFLDKIKLSVLENRAANPIKGVPVPSSLVSDIALLKNNISIKENEKSSLERRRLELENQRSCKS